MASDRNTGSYGNILKGISLFGGVQIFQILINLLRGKFVAMFLGPSGMGIASLFTTSTDSLIRFSTLGVKLAVVRETAVSKESSEALGDVVRVTRSIIRITGFIGAIICMILAPWLSEASFGTDDYAWQYRLLSIFVFLMVVNDGQLGLLQGLHETRKVAMTTLAGSLSGLFLGVPLYWLYGDKGIVPAMILLSLTTWICYRIGLHRVGLPESLPGRKAERRSLSRKILLTGMVLLSSSLTGTAATWLVNIFVRSWGDISDVGLFNAANSITMQYAGVVFAAMAMDYFPRLTAASHDEALSRTIIDRQMEIVAMLATPFSLLLAATAPLVIKLLLTPEFMPTLELFRWLALSILLKALCYPLGYLPLAKGKQKLFFWEEAIANNVLYLGLSLLFYHHFGLIGLGYSSVVEYTGVMIVYLLVNARIFRYKPNREACREIIMALIFGAAGFACSMIPSMLWSSVATGTVCVACAVRSAINIKARLR
ncbi:MAG: O-antigen translocase [Muribaculaceae bacterium]|nr:O-antigen translocase [Muribaculaceae bacterium]